MIRNILFYYRIVDVAILTFQRAQERLQQSSIHEFTVPNVQQLLSPDLAQNRVKPLSSFDTPCTVNFSLNHSAATLLHS